jgi:NAD(P)-dependent dehydrogenase (short-subunit alcohol dehydrogenase family)
MSDSHQHRVAVITGGASGIGRAFALRLAQEGCDIAIADLRPDETLDQEIRALGRQAWSARCDLANETEVRAFAAAALERYGRIDILVNNAAYIPLNPLEQLTLSEFRKVMAVNVEASLLLAQALVPGMRERGHGRIVNIISSTTNTPMPGFLSYTTSKMAAMGLVRSLAAEVGNCVGGSGITVNGISPGLTRTEAAARELPEALFAAVRERQLIKRTEVPEDLVGALAFLTSADAGFITGQVLNVDGGVVF